MNKAAAIALIAVSVFALTLPLMAAEGLPIPADEFIYCTVCHGVRGEGNIALGSPALTGLNDWYLVSQLRNFRDGTRGNQPGDTYGMRMRASAGLLSDDEAIHNVVTYISTLQDQ
ncbi:conserved exported protein of unknown function [uncultured Woeseiaceae bacterium]|uniref:Cytochrome c domain-containing protein n=1 Tax=uncultured Woeseiaceae bacterium TaxID=1983305 RepID=A0A7D9D1J8_9GAMM|nr:conserved exported protein of unknown function [uncultured Woeseiaceae bacterium]